MENGQNIILNDDQMIEFIGKTSFGSFQMNTQMKLQKNGEKPPLYKKAKINRDWGQNRHFNDRITVIISIRLIHAPIANATTLE